MDSPAVEKLGGAGVGLECVGAGSTSGWRGGVALGDLCQVVNVEDAGTGPQAVEMSDHSGVGFEGIGVGRRSG